MELSAARDAFPGSQRKVQLNAAAKSIASTRSLQAVNDFMLAVCDDAEVAYDPQVLETARVAAARYVGAASSADIALLPSTSIGLNVIADSIPLTSAGNVVTTDLEFVSVVAPWVDRCARTGAELRIVKTADGHIEVDRIVELIDERTRAVVLGSVAWTSGYRVDIARLGEVTRARGVPLIVDGIQELGALAMDVATANVDVLLAGGHKWLASSSAMGFLWASPQFSARHAPATPYAPTMSFGGRDWGGLWLEADFSPYQHYDVAPAARRFEVGVHHAALSATALSAALDTIADIGPDAIAAHSLALGAELAQSLTEQGFAVVSDLDPQHRSGLIVFDAGGPAANAAASQYLNERGIVVSVRYTEQIGGVRASCHMYNNSDDTARLVDELVRWRAAS